jgi:hypothetical protein
MLLEGGYITKLYYVIYNITEEMAQTLVPGLKTVEKEKAVSYCCDPPCVNQRDEPKWHENIIIIINIYVFRCLAC